MSNSNSYPHLILDLYSCPTNKLSDKNFIYEILNELPDLIGMEKISPCVAEKYDDSGQLVGITGVMLICESHVSVSTDVNSGCAFVDVYSCKNFNIDLAEKYVIEKFEPKKVKKYFLKRGKESLEFQEEEKIISS